MWVYEKEFEMIYDCIVVGSGPAGLMAGCHLSGKKNIILEAEEKMAQKLLLSGGGQCNLTHSGDIKTFFDRYGDKSRFVRKALSGFTNKDTMAFFNDRNTPLITREDGKVFPRSLDAWDVLRCLRQEVESLGVEIVMATKVIDIKYSECVFTIKTSKVQYQTKSIILAAGGASYPMTGSDGSGIKLSKELGHEIIDVKPALTPVYIKDFALTPLAGIAYTAGVITHWRGGKKLGSYQGDVLITHTGLSGPGILDNSRYMMAGDELKLRMLDADKTLETLEAELLKGRKKRVKTVVSDFMTKRTADLLVGLVGIENEQTCSELGKKARKMLLSYAEGLPMTIRKMGDLKSAMTTAGGVSTKEVAAGTMASKVQAGLYFAGEILDVDGDSGGFNIQWAFSSGRLAALSVNKYLEK